jgi:hypothetical protein
MITELLNLAKPTFVNGVWRKPAMSGRKMAALLKAQGDAVPAEAAKTSPYLRALKGHKHERNADARAAAIAKKMADMPKMVADLRKAKADAKKAIGITWLFKENAYKK